MIHFGFANSYESDEEAWSVGRRIFRRDLMNGAPSNRQRKTVPCPRGHRPNQFRLCQESAIVEELMNMLLLKRFMSQHHVHHFHDDARQ